MSKTLKQKLTKEYFNMARSLYNHLKKEGYELGKGSISNIATALNRQDNKIGTQNYRKHEFVKYTRDGKVYKREYNENFEPLMDTSLGAYFDYKNGYMQRDEYLKILGEHFTDSQQFYYEAERERGIDIDQRFKGFLEEFGDFTFKFSLNGQTHSMKQWVELYKQGNINLNTIRDIMDEFKHSNVYEDYVYSNKR